MNARETLEFELASLELNPETIKLMDEEVESISISFLFQRNHVHVVVPNDAFYAERILNAIHHEFGEQHKCLKKV